MRLLPVIFLSLLILLVVPKEISCQWDQETDIDNIPGSGKKRSVDEEPERDMPEAPDRDV